VRPVLLAILLSMPSGMALAAGPLAADAEREARSYLTPCASLAAGLQAGCAAVQADFVAQYRRAMSGNAWALVSTTADLAHADIAAVRGAEAFCAPAGDDGLALARARAGQLVDAMRAARVHQLLGAEERDAEDD